MREKIKNHEKKRRQKNTHKDSHTCKTMLGSEKGKEVRVGCFGKLEEMPRIEREREREESGVEEKERGSVLFSKE